MKKIKFLLIGLLLFVLVGCSSSNYNHVNEEDTGWYESSKDVVYNQALVNRKVIYNVNADISTKSQMDTYRSIKNSLETDEWFDSESITTNRITLVIRVKSSRLDEFLDTLANYGEVGNFKKDANDISLMYQDYSNRVSSLQAELGRLDELYPDASLHDMLTINKRRNEIISEIESLTGELNKFDSLVDYSVVNLTIYEHEIIKEPPFGNSIVDALANGWSAVLYVLKTLILVLSTILPFAIIIVPVTGIIIFAVKYQKKKNKTKE